MTTATAAKTVTKTRTLKILTPIDRKTGHGVIQITETTARGKVTVDTYSLKTAGRFSDGTEVTVEKITEGSTYTCLLSRGEGTCECKGFIRWNKCRHVSALLVLQSMGKLPTPTPKPVLPLDW